MKRVTKFIKNIIGQMTERFKVPDLKSGVYKCTVSSNLTLS